MSAPDPSLEPLDEPDDTWLDDEHVLEPVDPQDRFPELEAAPLVRDARGRLWKVRHRPSAWSWVPVAVTVLVVLSLLLVLSTWA